MMQAPQMPPSSPRGGAWKTALRVVARPALQFYIALWLLAAGIVWWTGFGSYLAGAAVTAGLVALLGLGTVALTPGAGANDRPAPAGRLWLQLAVIGLFVGLTALGGLSFHGLLSGRVPLWSQLVDLAESLGLPFFTLLVNPTMLFLLPFVALLAVGAKARELGFGRGARPWAVTLLWMVPGLLTLIVQAVMGQPPSPLRLLKQLGNNAVQNGFMEEFLFRGALQTRLSRLLGGDWGLILSSLLFGLWHLGLTTGIAGGNYVAGAALAIVNQATIGLGFGLIFRRTGNLLAPSLVHCWFNAV